MIKNIDIYGLQETEQILNSCQHNYTAWISTVDIEDSKNINKLKKLYKVINMKKLNLYFRDFDDSDSIADIEGPTEYIIKIIIDYLCELITDKQEHNLLINCYAGVSRSTSIGIITHMLNGDTPEEAYDKIEKKRKYIFPNPRILRIYDELKNSNSLSVVKEKEKQKSGKIVLF